MPNKKEKPVSKIDFDFSGISGEKRQKATKPKKETKEVTEAIPQKKGIMLSFQTEDGDWDAKDISEVTADEFLAWARGVYPAEINVGKDKLEKVQARVTIFKKILSYHVHSPFQMGKETKKDKEVLPN
jgi:hypothetical protein